MRVIALSRLREFWQNGHDDAEGWLRAWYKAAEDAEWEKFADVREQFPSVDLIGDKLVFNVSGNKYRLVVVADFVRKGFLVKWIGTHSEYDKLKVEEL